MRRPRLQQGVIILPSALTLGNLFFGMWAIVSAATGDFMRAGWLIVIAGIADTLDGRIARATQTGSRFGEELDSLVDAISFGLAPAMIMFFAVFNQHGWEWIFCFLFTMCAVIRLARFNVMQAGTAKKYFIGLPSPAAGLTLATYYWFSQTPLYNQTVLVDLPWPVMLRYIMVGLAFLMISNVKYPAVPTIGYKTWRGLLGSLIVLATLIGVIFLPKQFFFPALMAYVIWGVVRTVFMGMLDRAPDPGEVPFPGMDAEPQPAEDDDAALRRRRRRRRRFRRARSGPPGHHPGPHPDEEPKE